MTIKIRNIFICFTGIYAIIYLLNDMNIEDLLCGSTLMKTVSIPKRLPT